ncbi:Ribosomal protein S18 acetylase RimI [Rhizobiales bacterium GAS113]|nr:Ribosomal protein S18 acetylase RimI [Rhizobiales bacterium GAS113]
MSELAAQMIPEQSIPEQVIPGKMPEPEIRFAEAADASAVATLLRAMDTHYRPGDALPLAAEYAACVTRTLEAKEGTRFVLCLAAGEPLGVACIGVLRPGRDLKGLVFVKDVFVCQEAQGHGIGTKLMRFLAGFAIEQGLGRIDLTTPVSNSGAQRLYAALDGVVQHKMCFTFPIESLQRLAGTLPQGER